MTDPTTPNPTQVQRGSVVLTTALRISTLLPREQEAIFSILRTLNTADELPTARSDTRMVRAPLAPVFHEGT
jgi:hypothetical protein